jgi:hypothetical protein
MGEFSKIGLILGERRSLHRRHVFPEKRFLSRGGEQAFPILNAPQNDVQQLQTPLLAMPTEIGRSWACAKTPTSDRRATFTGSNLVARFDTAHELQSTPQPKTFTIECFCDAFQRPTTTTPLQRRRSSQARAPMERSLRSFVVGRARSAHALAAPTPAASLAPSRVIGRLPPALGRYTRARRRSVVIVRWPRIWGVGVIERCSAREWGGKETLLPKISKPPLPGSFPFDPISANPHCPCIFSPLPEGEKAPHRPMSEIPHCPKRLRHRPFPQRRQNKAAGGPKMTLDALAGLEPGFRQGRNR